MTIFKSLIKPHQDYYDFIWDAAWPSSKTNLQSIQEKALFIAYQGENDINKIHKVTKTLPVEIRTEMHLAQHMYNIIKLPSFLTTTFEYASHAREQRDLNLELNVLYITEQAWPGTLDIYLYNIYLYISIYIYIYLSTSIYISIYIDI